MIVAVMTEIGRRVVTTIVMGVMSLNYCVRRARVCLLCALRCADRAMCRGRGGSRGGFGGTLLVSVEVIESAIACQLLSGGFGDRDRGAYGDRDRGSGGGFGGGDRDRDRGFGGGDRDRDRGGYGGGDRDRGYGGGRDRGSGFGGDRGGAGRYDDRDRSTRVH
jgi:hypothetical protein